MYTDAGKKIKDNGVAVISSSVRKLLASGMTLSLSLEPLPSIRASHLKDQNQPPQHVAS
jgi:hypothetical protein